MENQYGYSLYDETMQTIVLKNTGLKKNEPMYYTMEWWLDGIMYGWMADGRMGLRLDVSLVW